MADVNRGNRPLSPHLTIYRPQMTSMSSIMVRITGIVSLGAAAIIVIWFLLAATAPGAFDVVHGLLQTLIGQVVLLMAMWCLFYHMLGRLRHVIWDFGYCLDVRISERLGIGMFALATLITALIAVVF